MQLIIQRSKWYHGKTGVGSKLLRADGFMCCLGFFALALEATKEEILNKTAPFDMVEMTSNVFEEKADWLFKKREDGSPRDNSETCCCLMKVNDNDLTIEKDREIEIARIFAAHGVEVVFVD